MNSSEIEIECLSNEIQQKSIIIARMNAKIFAQKSKIAKLQKRLRLKAKSTKDKVLNNE